MLAAILGKKIGMTQVYDDDGTLHPVTVIQAGPCSVLQVKTVETDGYNAMQLGFEDVKAQRAQKPAIGHAGKADAKPKKYVREFRLGEDDLDIEQGQTITVEAFDDVDIVDVVGTSKGRGYSGGMRRHGFKGQLQTHGVERKHRSPGSIAGHSSNAGTGPKIKKGKRMAGHYGHARTTMRNQKLVRIDKENNLLLVRGNVPGPNGGYVMVRTSKTAKVSQ
jgi:large subunit ribosomal protein L3